ncbi:Ribonuclease H1, N-terminal [Parasponia andersonii]|uniref:Ribonuclease H1, N-terminal n=1 Tax=Parasponia andersonii TaxID=3476 RepID=A0A2P5B8Q1_PARAD|nr:Ribonuclease H1, N-terminal [Parasponia andersonii]
MSHRNKLTITRPQPPKRKKQLMTFGDIDLQVFSNVKEQYIDPDRKKLDAIQQCLVDNIWNIPTPTGTGSTKVCIYKSLINYFVTAAVKPAGKKFSCYALFTGDFAGVHGDWSEVSHLIQTVESAQYKGYYSSEEALEACRKVLGPNFYISASMKRKAIQDEGIEGHTQSSKEDSESESSKTVPKVA